MAAVADPEAELHPETELTQMGNGHQVVRGAGPGTRSPLWHAQDCEGAESTGEFQHKHYGSASPRSDLHVVPCVLQPCVHYLLNSKCLTAWQLQVLASVGSSTTFTYLGIH